VDELYWAGAGELSRLLRDGQVSAREVVEAHLRRIESVNPKVNALVTVVAEQAMAEAEQADKAWALRSELGPLHGLPIAHKDTHETAGIRTTYGSPLFADNVPDTDELVIERLRGAGAITVGKTNVPVFAAGSHTVNPLFGATRNPYDLGRSAGGSSGGAAAALATGMHALADGSDMGGSLRNPASFNNVVGLRPSPGRVPSWPDPLPWSPLTVQGPMARSVADVALALSVLAGPDPRAPAALDRPGSDVAGSLTMDLTGLRVAWAPDLAGRVAVDPEVSAVLHAAPSVFTTLGCTVELDCPDLTDADEVFRTLRAWRFELVLGEIAASYPDEFTGPLLDSIERGRALSGADVARAEAAHAALFQRVREFFSRYDLLLAPVSQVPPFSVEWAYPSEIAGHPMPDDLEWMASAYLISATGCPALSVPAGFTPGGLPIGLQIIGPHHGDLAVLRAGHAFEQATGHGERRPPL
jgi:amidase